MNKVTEIANKRIEAIRSEIRRMLDDKGKEDRFYRLEELYSRYLQVQALCNTASDMDNKSFEDNNLVGGFVNNNVAITGSGNVTDITESLNNSFNHTVTSIRFM